MNMGSVNTKQYLSEQKTLFFNLVMPLCIFLMSNLCPMTASAQTPIARHTTYLYPPHGHYHSMFLTPQAPGACDPSVDLGRVILDNSAPPLLKLRVCQSDSTWETIVGVWDKNIDNLYPVHQDVPELARKKVGIGTSVPELKLDLDVDGGIIARGEQGLLTGNLLTTNGAGTRMVWYPVAAAFRAGTVDGSQWQWDSNPSLTFVGDYTVAFGENTIASGNAASVGGGRGNIASGNGATISGGINNSALSLNSTIGGGSLNLVEDTISLGTTCEGCTIAGGTQNFATGQFSHIGGGSLNTAAGDYATMGGGSENFAMGGISVIGGGRFNNAYDLYSTILGGWESRAFEAASFVGGGGRNYASATWAVIGGGGGPVSADGDGNTNIGLISFIGGGNRNAIDESSNAYSVIGGGLENFSRDSYTFVGGGQSNGTIGDFSTVCGGNANLANGFYSVVCGGNGNSAITDSAIGGGSGNIITSDYSAILGGQNNTVSATFSAIGGGQGNTVAGSYSYAAGLNNLVTGAYSVIPGGSGNFAGGDYSFVGGRNMRSNEDEIFLWGHSATPIPDVMARGSFIIYSGDVGFGITNPNAKLHVNGTIKAILNNVDDVNPLQYHSVNNEIGYDIAELFDASEEVTVGDVLVVDDTDNLQLRKSQRPYEKGVVGVVSGAPAILFEGSELSIAPKPGSSFEGNKPPVALSGRITCKVSTENGPIELNDHLTTSSTPGHAMKASDEDQSFGTIVGKALESFDGGPNGETTGFITILVTLQ